MYLMTSAMTAPVATLHLKRNSKAWSGLKETFNIIDIAVKGTDQEFFQNLTADYLGTSLSLNLIYIYIYVHYIYTYIYTYIWQLIIYILKYCSFMFFSIYPFVFIYISYLSINLFLDQFINSFVYAFESIKPTYISPGVCVCAW